MEQKILIIRLGAIGDIIRTLPAVKYISDFYKKNSSVEIHWLAEKHNANILEDLPYISRIFKLPRKDWQKRLFSKDILRVITEFKKFIGELKKENYTLVIDFHGIFKSGLLSILTGCKKRIGFTKKYSKEFNFIFNNIRIPAAALNITRIEKNFTLVSYFDKDYKIPDKFENILNITEMDKKITDNFFKENNIGKFICINPAVSKLGAYKEWREDYYSKLCDLILEKYKNIFIVLTWGPGEIEKIERIISAAKKDARLLAAPKTTMKELSYLISKSELLITGDTGPMHLAAVTATPIAALFGPSDPVINAPYGKNNIVFYEDVKCNPCRNRKCSNLICQSSLIPETVFAAINKRFLLADSI